MYRKILFALSLLFLPTFLLGEESVLVTLKLLKAPGAATETAFTTVFPASCVLCRNVDDPAYARQNVREIVLAMRIPVGTPVALHLVVAPRTIRRIRLENTDLRFTAAADGIDLAIPPQKRDRTRSGDFQTHLGWSGIDLRVEHADPLRRAGNYATGEFPALQRQAALNLEFGLLEAIRKLSLDKTVVDRKLGLLKLMGFDTNYPHGHRDFPPHMHLTLWLSTPESMGTRVPHLYLTPQGLLSHSAVSAPNKKEKYHAEYGANQAFTVPDLEGNPVYSLTITPEGGLQIALPAGSACELTPRTGGFQSGTVVFCTGTAAFIVQAEDNIDKGELRETIDGTHAEIFHYDADTGTLLKQ